MLLVLLQAYRRRVLLAKGQALVLQRVRVREREREPQRALQREPGREREPERASLSFFPAPVLACSA